MKELKTYRLSAKCLENLNTIKTLNNLGSITSAIEFSAEEILSTRTLFNQQNEINNHLKNIYKSLNQSRKDDYITVDLLNAIVLSMETDFALPHHQTESMSTALQSAHTNYEGYIQEHLTRRKTNSNEV